MNKRLSLAAMIFHEVVEATPERRDAILVERCAGDQELRALVGRLLANDQDGMGAFLTPPAPPATTPPARSEVPAWIGP